MKRTIVVAASAVAAGLLGTGLAVPAYANDPSCAQLADAPLTRSVVAGSSAAIQDLWSTADPTVDGAVKAGHLTPGHSYAASDPAPDCTKGWTTGWIALSVDGVRRSVSATVVYEQPDPSSLRFDSLVKPAATFGTRVYRAPSAESERASPATLDAAAKATSAEYTGKPYLGGSGRYRAIELPDGKAGFVDRQDVVDTTQAELDVKTTAKPEVEATPAPKASAAPSKHVQERVEPDLEPKPKAASQKERDVSAAPHWLEAPGSLWVGAVGGGLLGFVGGVLRLVSRKQRR